MSEDYAPFDIDVTTQDPGTAAITRSSSTDEAYGTRVLVTNSDPGVCPSGPCGGVAFLGVIDQIGSEHDRLQPVWVFRSSLISTKNIGEAISHEAGHNLGLNHDGQLESGVAHPSRTAASTTPVMDHGRRSWGSGTAGQ